jgi:hypothetical protein
VVEGRRVSEFLKWPDSGFRYERKINWTGEALRCPTSSKISNLGPSYQRLAFHGSSIFVPLEMAGIDAGDVEAAVSVEVGDGARGRVLAPFVEIGTSPALGGAIVDVTGRRSEADLGSRPRSRRCRRRWNRRSR